MKFKLRTQNLNEKPGDVLGSIWKHGRAWLHRVVDGESKWPPLATFEWSHGRTSLAATLHFNGGEREVTAHLAVPGGSYCATFVMPRWLVERLPWKAHGRKGGWDGVDRNIGIRVFDGAIWLSLWEDGMSWRSDDPWWTRATIRLDDLLLGKAKYATREISKREVKVPMPEGSYDATATLEHATWTRPRWPWRPFSKELLRVKIDVPKGIGHPGKGENSYDCGPDATYGISTPARTVEEGIGKLVASVLRDRVRYGGGHADTGGHTQTEGAS